VSSLWFGIDLANQHEIAVKFDRLSLQSWGLTNRTLNALLSHNFKMTVGDVIRAGENLVDVRGLGEAGLQELDTRVSQLLADTHKNLDALLSVDQPIIMPTPETSVDPLPKLLPRSVQNLALNQLHLDGKTYEGLIKAGITTIGELYNASDHHLSNIQGFHPSSLGNINGTLIALLNSLNKEDDVNWFQYWEAQGIQILPPTSTSNTLSEQVIGKLPQIIEEVFRRESNERAWLIIQRRFGLGKAEKLTLEEMGSAFGISRERIRQLEEKALGHLRKVLVEGYYTDKSYQVHPAIHLLIQTIRNSIEAEPSKLILETKLFGHIGQTLNIDARNVKTSLFLMLTLMGIERLEFDYPNAVPAWGYVKPDHRRIFENGIKRLDDLLTREMPLPQSEFDILVHLNRKAKKSERLTIVQLSWLIDLCNSVERCEDGAIWGKFEYLKGRGNQVERMLSESGVPMSIAALAREINHRLVPLGQRRIVEQNLANQIIADDRFVSIGHSGKWGLKSWSHIDTKNILILMEECLITYNRPTTIDEIFVYVSDRRPVSRHSIIMYLTYEKEIFVKAGRTTWRLTKWSDVTEPGTWNTEQVANIFRSNKSKELSYTLLREALMKEAGVNAKQAQGLLNSNPVIKTRSRKSWGERIAIFQPNYKTILTQAKSNTSRQKVSLRKRVEETAYEILKAAPDKQMPMTELIHQLSIQLEGATTTFYNYLHSMDFIQWIDVPNSRTKIGRLREMQKSANGGTLRERIGESVRSILDTAPDKQMLLSELLVCLRKEYSCPNSTLYQYVAHLDDIERFEIPNSRTKLCRIKGTQSSDLFPQVQNIADSTLREKVERTLPFLTEENVDIGLLLLSKEFEATLKTYLLIAIAKGKLAILPPGKTPDKWNLIGMVECARDNGIISDHATFHYLRQARNDRAHGTMPSLAERQLLIKSIQYIAGLYIDYIKLLDDLAQNL